jgi:hypothetical protein
MKVIVHAAKYTLIRVDGSRPINANNAKKTQNKMEKMMASELVLYRAVDDEHFFAN